ncbi:zinc ribbon domain-containing protein [Methanobrevibacter sp.]|uniref:zinc ribbon domain-containing protein n=1 Tax=Methanobrevibacter sp. TaxID=66852 RepID=UPI0026E07C98|nr:zinc ribbon domain-containing protein [Methanobrevibacter sp.]MDO5859650.1 zinc ribbon domain-containing protein [Methanobrevibacter sp.]
MTKKCPKCGKQIPDESNFCLNCGCHIYNKDSGNDSNSIFSNGKIFLVLIFVVLIVGGILIFSMGGSDDGQADDGLSKLAKEFSFTITDVNGNHNSADNSYFYWVEVLFQKVPSNQKDYIVKVIYLDENNTEVGQEIQSLADVYYEADYGLSVGYHTSYKYIDVDSVKVQIIKENEVIKETSAKVDKNKLNFENPDKNNTK